MTIPLSGWARRGPPRWLRAPAVLALLLTTVSGLALAQSSPDPPSPVAESSVPDLLRAIGELEAVSDAKCQATASRLEDLMYGTPLSEEARREKVRLQKELVRALWSGASRQAALEGREQVGRGDLAPLLAAALRFREEGDGGVVVFLADGSPLRLTATDLTQYSSVSYALRALLAVQQDALLMSGERLLPASPEALDDLRRLLDLRTLAALALADRQARSASQPQVTAAAITAAWAALPGPPASSAPAASASAAGTASPPADSRELTVLRGIVEQKVASYEAYNRIDREEAERTFVLNAQRFYSRYFLPPSAKEYHGVLQAFQGQVLAYAAELLHRAQQAAVARGEPVLRVEEVERAVQALTPHRVTDQEDVVFFPRLPRERRFQLEAYDMDAFRDYGLHWKLLGLVLEHPRNPLSTDLDPFAAEAVAEAVAQYGVLVWRIAGDIARSEAELPFLTAEHLVRAGRAVPVLAELDAAAPESVADGGEIVSSHGAAPAAAGTLFEEVAAQHGLSFTHGSADWLARLRRTLPVTPPTFSGGGIAAEDVDGDGLIDLLLVGGQGNALLLADGRGGFTDATAAAGLTFRRPDGLAGEARQPLIADFDNDGLQDVLITYVNDPHRLYRNLGGGRFEDVSAAAGLGGEGLVGGPATAFDFDRDGLLDLYIGYFGNYLEGEVPERVQGAATPGAIRPPARDEAGAVYTGAAPTLARDNTNALPNRLLRNLGGLRFADVTEASGTGNRGWTQAVAHSDLDGDGWQDLVVANDFGKNAVYRNLGDGRFAEVSEELGLTDAYHSMNVGIADLNLDQSPDLYISNINTMVKDTRYVLPNEGTPMHLELAALATMRVQERSILFLSTRDNGHLGPYVPSNDVERGETSVGWAWDADFFDFDNDGDDDLYVVNGANEYRLFEDMLMAEEEPGRVRVHHFSHDRESNVLYVNAGGRLINGSVGSGCDVASNARSAVYLDVDGDGDLDIAVNNFHTPAQLFRNHAERLGNHWLRIRLVGDPERGSNRDAIGALLQARTADGARIWREVHGGSGYLSMEPRQQHLGLGAAREAEVTVRWPNGEVQDLGTLGADREYIVEQGGEAVVASPRNGLADPRRPTAVPGSGARR